MIFCKKATLAKYLQAPNRVAVQCICEWEKVSFDKCFTAAGGGAHNTGGASFKTPFLSRGGEGQQTISSAPSSFCQALLLPVLSCDTLGVYALFTFPSITLLQLVGQFQLQLSSSWWVRNDFSWAREADGSQTSKEIISNFPPLTWFILGTELFGFFLAQNCSAGKCRFQKGTNPTDCMQQEKTSWNMSRPQICTSGEISN